MNRKLKLPTSNTVLSCTVFVLLAAIALISFSAPARAQGGRLSLADILTGLRSKKVPLTDRNKILSDAVIVRGTTFTITPEIESELASTGADRALIDAIRSKGAAVKPPALTPSSNEAAKKSTADPVAPDAAFYERRAGEHISAGNMDAALADLTKAIELNGQNAGALRARSLLYSKKGLYTLAIADLTSLIGIDPRDATAYINRADVHEKKGNIDLAVADLTRALELDGSNEAAVAAMARLRPAPLVVPETAAKPISTPQEPGPTAVVEFVDLGQLDERSAVKMIRPVYPQAAAAARLSGKVVVEVELDKEGNVTAAKARSGHGFLTRGAEEAARKSRFKPAMAGNVPVKGRGTIIYNFVP